MLGDNYGNLVTTMRVTIVATLQEACVVISHGGYNGPTGALKPICIHHCKQSANGSCITTVLTFLGSHVYVAGLITMLLRQIASRSSTIGQLGGSRFWLGLRSLLRH